MGLSRTRRSTRAAPTTSPSPRSAKREAATALNALLAAGWDGPAVGEELPLESIAARARGCCSRCEGLVPDAAHYLLECGAYRLIDKNAAE